MKQLMLLLAVTGSQLVTAQQDIQFTQYMDNTLSVNPGYAGSRGLLNATLIHREQWIGMDGRPQSTTFSVHSPLSYESLGLGVTVVNDIIGPLQQTSVFGDLSYTLNFKNSNSKLAFGAKFGINMLNSRTSQLQTTDSDDPNLLSNIQNQIDPNFGFGIYYHNPKFFVGLSSPKILEQSYGSSTTATAQRHYFAIAGGVFNLTKNEMWKLRPTTQVKMTTGAPLSIDLSVAAIYNKKVWIGLAHRWQDSFGAFVQYQITPQFKAGLAFDQTITELSGYNMGTFEALLSYDFVFKTDGVRSPRYF